MDPEPTPFNREEMSDLLNRINFEHGILVSRTAALLTLNGLLVTSVGVGTNLPNPLKCVMAIVMIVLNVLWVFRAASGSKWIDTLTAAAYHHVHSDVLPPHATPRQATQGPHQ